MNVSGSGNLTADPELRFTQNGTAVCTFTVAQNRKRGDDDVAHFFDVTCWKHLAEHVKESLSKGDNVLVSGVLEQQRWQNDQGENRSKVAIVAWDVATNLRFATAKPEKVASGGGGGSGRQEQAPPPDDDDVPF